MRIYTAHSHVLDVVLLRASGAIEKYTREVASAARRGGERSFFRGGKFVFMGVSWLTNRFSSEGRRERERDIGV